MSYLKFVFWTGEEDRKKERQGIYTLHCIVFKVGTKMEFVTKRSFQLVQWKWDYPEEWSIYFKSVELPSSRKAL